MIAATVVELRGNKNEGFNALRLCFPCGNAYFVRCVCGDIIVDAIKRH